MSLYTDNALLDLKTRGFGPYCHLSANNLLRLREQLRFIELNAAEALTLTNHKGGSYLSVLEGRIGIDPGAGNGALELDAASTTRQAHHVDAGSGTLTIRALEDTLVCYANGDAVDYLISWDSLAASSSAGDPVLRERFAVIRQCLAFRRIPLEYVEEAFRRMSSRTVAAGEVVIRQGDPGDAFYVIAQGRAEVWRMELDDEEPKKVAELMAGDAFGDEALVVRGSRNATVRMTTGGELLVLNRDDFDNLVSRPIIREVEPGVARAMLESGFRLLDVRYPEEHEERRIPGSVLIPLHELRARIGEMDPGARYIVYCRSGKRSAVASLLLGQRRIEAASLKGGINAWPY